LRDSTDKVLALLNAHGTRIYGVLLRLTLRHDVADDLLQELFVRLSRHSGFRRALDPAAYAVRTATNLALDWRRAQARLRGKRSIDQALDAIHSTNHSPLSDLVDREETERVLDAVSELPQQGREIVVMHFLEEQSYDDIGSQLQRTPHQVRAMCHKAMERLRRRLGVTRTILRQSGESHDER